MYRKRLQYQKLAFTPIPPSTVVVFVHQPTDIPLRNWAVKKMNDVAVVAFFPVQALLNLFPNSVGVSSQQDVIISFPKVTQYQGLAFVDTEAFRETVEVSKWHPASNIPLFDKKRLQFLYPTFWLDSFPVPEPPTITVDMFYSPPEIPVRRVDNRNYLGGCFFDPKPIEGAGVTTVPLRPLVAMGL